MSNQARSRSLPPGGAARRRPGTAGSVAGSLVLLLLTSPALAAGERATLQAERDQLNARFAAEERACATRFAVNACQDDVRARRREALAPLRERELQLDQAERVQRAAARRAAIEAKRKALAALPAASGASSAGSAGSAPQLRVREPVVLPPATAASRPARGRDETARAAEAAARAREAEQRREQAQAAQQRVQQRQADREAAGKKDAPLPVPAR
jgi:colicin import membrane protein